MIVELGFTDTEFIAINKFIGFWGLIDRHCARRAVHGLAGHGPGAVRLGLC